MTTATISRNGTKQQTNQAPVAATERAANPALRFELKAKTERGAQLVALAEELAAQFTTRAAEHDREGTYPYEAIDALVESGYHGAPFSCEFGGLGVDSIHDLVVASSRLARGDASVTIGINMHLAAVANIARRYSVALASGNEKRIAAFGQAQRSIVDGRIVMAAGVSEAAQDLTRPMTRAERTEDGWVINGKKIFCTMSPAANTLYVAVTFTNDDGEEMYGYAQFPKSTPGVTVNDDWDALGMRASGSHSVTFENVRVPASALRGGFPAGILTPDFMERNLTAGAFHASSSLGIAESAHDIAVKAQAGKLNGSDEVGGHTQMLVSQNAIDLSAMRSILARAGDLIDEYYAAHPTSDGDLEEMGAIFAEVQSAKTFINETAQRVVDRALSLSGGAGYFNKHPLSRAYRDVRAGAFMHPLGANRAYDFIGRIALGFTPKIS